MMETCYTKEIIPLEGWSREEIDHVIKSGERKDAKLTKPVPLYWVYVTAWATPDGVVQFRDDIYNRDGHHVAADPFALFPRLGVEADGAHAFYLGYELAKAEIAYALGKRYTQDNPLDWGVAAERKAEDLTRHAHPGATLARPESGVVRPITDAGER